jgi:stage V sporulation protein T
MKATGIVRRIDDLGRVIIPKEIRRSMNVKEGDLLEIFVQENGVVFKKYIDTSTKEAIDNIFTAAKAVCPKIKGIEYEDEVFGVKGNETLDFIDNYDNTYRFWFERVPSIAEMEFIQKIVNAFTD